MKPAGIGKNVQLPRVETGSSSVVSIQSWKLKQTTVIARIYADSSVEYNPPSDALHPPAEGELRIVQEPDNIQHLQILTGNEWQDLGEVTDELLAKHGLSQLKGF